MTTPGTARRHTDLSPHYGERVRIVDDHEYVVPTPSGGRVSFRLQLFAGQGLRPVAVATQVSGDAGSVVNMAEIAEEHVRTAIVPDETEPLLWIQHIAYDGSPPSSQLVVFTEPSWQAGGRTVLTPDWNPILAEQIEGLLGAGYDLGRGDQYVPPPKSEPEPRQVWFEVIAVDRLPATRPFREPGCMSREDQPGSRWKYGRRGFLRRRLLRLSCCRYHRGDWRLVNQLAEKYLLDPAISSSGDIVHTMLQVIEDAELDEWTADALASLFADPIDLNQWVRPWTYVNGQHRVQAMRDARVPRTVIAHFD